MLYEIIQAFALAFVLIFTIYLVHQSKMRLIRIQEKSTLSMVQLSETMGNIYPVLRELKKTGDAIEKYNNEQKNNTLMCLSNTKEHCKYCYKVGECPFGRTGGEDE